MRRIDALWQARESRALPIVYKLCTPVDGSSDSQQPLLICEGALVSAFFIIMVYPHPYQAPLTRI